MARVCPFYGCGTLLPPDLFCCRPHWYSLSYGDMSLLRAVFREYAEGTIDLEKLRKEQQAILGSRGDAWKASQPHNPTVRSLNGKGGDMTE